MSTEQRWHIHMRGPSRAFGDVRLHPIISYEGSTSRSFGTVVDWWIPLRGGKKVADTSCETEAKGRVDMEPSM